MTAALFDYQTILPHPIEDVFTLTVDLQNAPHWHSIFTEVEQLTPNPIGLGSKWQVSYGLGSIAHCQTRAFSPIIYGQVSHFRT